ncbi:SAV_2336 N-terminal domain-related protein [Mastigocoleus testarum]|uniref:Sulfatase-modifying factor enzyme-like domain-containing protein n=1 Tax=Mastigocoleus testarum BC008 TaxID=371196 RepID=A0A0V7ZKA4_9CYAN|nr:SAV_2336 N-terminal domain-related protein [Mastigocoleus testarum]KST64955.1 hypothetical protein BC008_19300 [Mastigocoleus testarum BC008]KST64996.1 hypothetical protein BC008_19505 [Mastigocoleus testarum BC008]
MTNKSSATNNQFNQLIAALGKDLELTGEEIADIIWFNQKRQEVIDTQNNISSQQVNQSSTSEELNPTPTNTNTSEKLNSNPRDTETSFKPPSAEIYPKTQEETQQEIQDQTQTSSKTKALPLRVPDAPSLREPLTLAQVLKPLMHRVESGRKTVLDETATVERTAAEGICIPILKSEPEPWLDVALVVDESKSMLIWRHTIWELKRLLEHYGVFRDVRAWGLVTNENGQIHIRPGIGQNVSQQRFASPREILDPNRRRLILLVSDCVAATWRNGALTQVLKDWTNTQPVAIIQMLPDWLWLKTALGLGAAVSLGSLTAGVANKHLLIKQLLLWKDINLDTGIKIPVLTLEPDPALAWSQMLAGKSDAVASGFVLSSEIKINHSKQRPLTTIPQVNAQERVYRFRMTASPMARKLAGLLAAAPVINLPVVRLIQETLLPKSRQAHVAEVFLGGLLKPLTPIEADTLSDTVQYDFMDDEIRGMLLEAAPVKDSADVLDAVSEYVAAQLGKSLQDFVALLKAPGEADDEGVKPFAEVTAKILKRLGGDYALFAEELEQQITDESTSDITVTVPNNRHLLWQQKNTKIYSLCTSYPWYLPFDALVIPVSYHTGEEEVVYWSGGRFANSFCNFLGQNRILCTESINNIFKEKNQTEISPENPLFVPLPDEINNQLFISSGYQANRFAILTTVESPSRSVANTNYAVESVIRLAAEQRLKRVLLPLLGTGANRLPVYHVATAILPVINQVLKAPTSNPIEEITLVSEKEIAIKTINEVAQSLYVNNEVVVKSNRWSDFKFEVVTVNRRGKIIDREIQQASYFIENLAKNITLEMVAIRGGIFTMGAPETEEGSRNSERPQHEVTVPDFFMGKYPVTQAQWRAIAALPKINRDLKSEPSRFKGDKHPVERISWYDAVEFCDRISKYTGKQYRLPSEAEWEYACRAGTTTPFHFGETITSELANYNAQSTYGAGTKGTYRGETTEVGTLGGANAFGLYDMHGNVWEWCEDTWHRNYEGAPTDGSAWIDGTENNNCSRLLLRGGSWYFAPEGCRCAYRYNHKPEIVYHINGLRVVCGVLP